MRLPRPTPRLFSFSLFITLLAYALSQTIEADFQLKLKLANVKLKNQ